MNLLCPNCQKMLQVPDQFAGQMMKCPLCGGAFTVPTPPASSGPAASAPVYSATAGTGPSAPPAGYQQSYSLVIHTKALAWMPAVALFLVFFLMFFPWLEAGVAVNDNRYPTSGWQTAFGEMASGLGMLYGLLLLLSLALAVASAVLPSIPAANLPPALQQLMPWRAVVVAGAALLVLVMLVLELAAGFGPEHYDKHAVLAYLGKDQALFFSKTVFVMLALLCHVLAALAAALDASITLGGPGKPPPRLDIHW